MGLIRKKIVIVFNNLNIGGIETKIVDICNFYSKQNDYQIYLLLKSRTGQLLKSLPKNIIVISPQSKSFLKIKTIIFPFWLAKQFREIKANLIISFGNYSSISSVLGRIFSFSKSKIIISDDSGLEKQIKKETFSVIRKELIKITYPMADEIILLTETGRNNLTELIPKDESKIAVKKNWLPLSFKKTEFKQKRDIDILFLARFEPQKNPLKFLKIIKKIKEKNNKIKVYMVGFGSLKSEIESFIKNNNLTKNVLVKEATVTPKEYYQRVKLLILTSDYEGFPLTILEAFSQECIPVCNKIPEICDFFEKYPEDILYNNINEAVNKILSLLDDQEKMKKICLYYQKKIFLEQKVNFNKTIDEFEKYCK